MKLPTAGAGAGRRCGWRAGEVKVDRGRLCIDDGLAEIARQIALGYLLVHVILRAASSGERLRCREEIAVRAKIERRHHPETRTAAVPFAEKEIEFIRLSLRKAPERGNGIQLDRTFDSIVYAAYVNGEPFVDEHPHVIVAPEIECLSFFIFELGAELHSK